MNRWYRTEMMLIVCLSLVALVGGLALAQGGLPSRSSANQDQPAPVT